MRSLKVLRCVFMVVLAVGVAAGCRRGRVKGGAGGPDIDEGLGVTPLGGEAGTFALGDRAGAEGERITEVRFESVLFAYDSFQIEAGETAKIDAVAEYLRRNPTVRLVTEGHCDERGSREYNMSLGEYRALAVRAHLIGLGIDGTRVQTRSFGEEQPVDAGHNEPAWRLNRRVEFALYR